MQYDVNHFVKALKAKCGGTDAAGKRTFDWKRLGHEAGVCFHSVPSRVVFLSGAVAVEDTGEPVKKKRRVYQRASTQDLEDSVEEVLVADETIGDHERSPGRDALFSTEVQRMKKALKAQCAAARHASKQSNGSSTTNDSEQFDNEIDMVPFLVNPKSYTQTIENFMNLSHLLKKGNAGVRKGQDGIMYIRSISSKHKHPTWQDDKGGHQVGQHPLPPPPRQAVLSLTMRDWRALIKAYQLTEGGLPHREYGGQTIMEPPRPVATASESSTAKLITGEQALNGATIITSGSSSSEENKEGSEEDGSVDEKSEGNGLVAIPMMTQQNDAE